ncbi:MAG: hypothetical protein CBC06_004380 [bacterium TMED46]|nr:MAG: hypothetical protein CBC06_004380 [bacterium TMED46]
MADTSTQQPTIFDYAGGTTWRLNIERIPLVTFFLTSCQIPGVNLGQAMVPTPLLDQQMPGDKLTFEPLNITFMVDEELTNYKELWNWIVGIGFPQQHPQYTEVLGTSNRPTSYSRSEDAGSRISKTPTDAALYSDATLIVYNSKNLPKLQIKFKDLYPTSLSALEYSNADTDVDYLSGIVTLNYLYYNFETHK